MCTGSDSPRFVPTSAQVNSFSFTVLHPHPELARSSLHEKAWTACLSYLALGSGCEYSWNPPLMYSQKRRSSMCCYNRDGGAGFTLTTIWRAATVKGMPPPLRVIIRGVTRQGFWGNLLSYPLSTLTLFYSLSSLLCFCLYSSSSLCANVVGSKDNSVMLHTSSVSTVQSEGDAGRRGKGGCCLERFGSRLSAADHSQLCTRRGSALLSADHLGEAALADGEKK